jgi:hypothetical protein
MFFWSSKTVPWIRWASAVTFKLMHPNWEVFFHTDAPDPPSGHGVHVRPIDKPPEIDADYWDILAPATKSDIWRWWQLGMHGGLYADTDVVFCGNVEELVDGLDKEGFDCGFTLDRGTRMGGRGYGLSIGVVTSTPGCELFKKATSELCRVKHSGYQSAGTVGLLRIWKQITEGVKIGNLPGRFFYPFEGNTSVMGRCWSGRYALPEHCLGIHWYGGRRLVIGPTFDTLQECPVRQALIRAGWDKTLQES